MFWKFRYADIAQQEQRRRAESPTQERQGRRGSLETQLLNTPSLGLWGEQETSCDVLLVIIVSHGRLEVCDFVMIGVV